MHKQPPHIRRRLLWAMLISAIVHIALFVLLGIKDDQKPFPKHPSSQPLDIVLLPPKEQSQKPPEKADTISNRNAKGRQAAGHDKRQRMAKAPAVGHAQTAKPQAPSLASPPVKAHKRPDQQRTLAIQSNKGQSSRLTKKPPHETTKPKPKPTTIPLQNLLPSSMALAQLSRNVQREQRMENMLTREADVPINTREVKYAPYAQQLVRSLEEQWRPGMADYASFSEHARRSLLKVTIERNGELSGVEIIRPSPIPELNESAIKAIHDAAPFHPLPGSWGLDRVHFYLTFEVTDNRFIFRGM